MVRVFKIIINIYLKILFFSLVFEQKIKCREVDGKLLVNHTIINGYNKPEGEIVDNYKYVKQMKLSAAIKNTYKTIMSIKKEYPKIYVRQFPCIWNYDHKPDCIRARILTEY